MTDPIIDDKTLRPRDGSVFSIARTSFEAGFKQGKHTNKTLEQAMVEFESLIQFYVQVIEDRGK